MSDTYDKFNRDCVEGIDVLLKKKTYVSTRVDINCTDHNSDGFVYNKPEEGDPQPLELLLKCSICGNYYEKINPRF